MFYLCDKERMESVKRLINLIIYSKHTNNVKKDELKKDLKKISSIRCQNNIEPLYSIDIKKKKRRGCKKNARKNGKEASFRYSEKQGIGKYDAAR